MKILDLAVIVLLLLFGVAGWRKGFVKKLSALLSLVLSIALVSFCLPVITDFIKEETPVYEYIVEQCSAVLTEQVKELAAERSSIQAENAWGEAGADSWSLSRPDQTELIENLPLPASLIDRMLDYNNDEGYQRLGVEGFQDYVTHYMATAILNILAFFAAALVVHILLRIVFAILNVVSRVPVIRFLNRALGLALGIVQGLLLVWILCLILSLASGTEWGLSLLAMVQRSPLLCALYDENPLMGAILRGVEAFL